VSDDLAELQARFRTMADTAPVLLWMAGRDAECDFFNQVWLDFTGRSLEQERGVGWAEGVHPEDFQRCMQTFMDAFVARRPFRMEYRLRRHDGVYRWILDTGVPRRSGDGEFVGFIGSCIDVTEQKEAQAALEAQRAELAARLAEREVLLREVHHRVKNNLQIVSSLLALRGAGLADAAARQAVEASHGAVEAIAQVHELLYAADDFGAVGWPAYLERLARSVLASQPGAAVALELEVEPLPLALDRAVPCGLIVNELVSNALRHGFPAGRAGTIRVALCRDGADHVVLVVRDDGVGMVAAGRPEAVGLRLVAALARQLRGSLERGPGPGTEIRLRFPR
jgi:two-component system, sensor histidine kinase PdtaS